MTWPVLVFWVLLTWGVFSRGPVLLHLFFASAAFGTLAVVPVQAVGGINLLPQAVCAAALVGKSLLDGGMRRRAIALAFDLRGLGWLTLFWAMALIVTAFAPRIFAGAVDVVSISGVKEGPQPLRPGSYNFTQMAYLTLSVATTLVFAALPRDGQIGGRVRESVLVGGAVLALSGFAVMALDAAGLSTVLDAFRTVNYALLTEVETLGVRRLTGLMAEASSFGALAVVYAALVAFLVPGFRGRWRTFAAGLALVLFLLAVLSTSSTAYVGIILCLGLLATDWLRRLTTPVIEYRSSSATGYFVATGLVATGLGVLLFAPHWIDYAHRMVDLMLFEKVTSDSYFERMSWNETAFNGFLATSGIGVGMGSARASNWFVAVLSNTGLVASLFMALFILQTFGRRSPARSPGQLEILVSLKASLLVCLALAALAGTSADFGVGVAAIYGLITHFGCVVTHGIHRQPLAQPSSPEPGIAA
ncbi:hypothetical protein [Terrihabitans sp. B22-R8]|uniref:hypothetical protein n=1 Tax=Terrihabitans sp. B22-R8 TaxID=3425128 RepID=UPI00403C7FF4